MEIGSSRQIASMTCVQLHDTIKVEWQLESAAKRPKLHELALINFNLTTGIRDQGNKFSLPSNVSLLSFTMRRVSVPKFDPKWHASCPNLIHLKIQRAGLSTLPALPPQLQSLDIQNNSIQYINIGSALHTLEHIDVRGNLIKDLNALRDFSSATLLQEVLLHPNPITVGNSQIARRMYQRMRDLRLAGSEAAKEESLTAHGTAWRRAKAVIRNVLPSVQTLDGTKICSTSGMSIQRVRSAASSSPSGLTHSAASRASLQGGATPERLPRVALEASRQAKQKRHQALEAHVKHSLEAVKAQRKALSNRKAMLQIAFSPETASPALTRQTSAATRLAQPVCRKSDQELFDLDQAATRPTGSMRSRQDLQAMSVEQRRSLAFAKQSDQGLYDTSPNLSRGAWLFRKTVPTSFGVSLVATKPSRNRDDEALARSLAHSTVNATARIQRLQELSTPKQRVQKHSTTVAASPPSPPRPRKPDPAVRIQKWIKAAHGVLQNAGAIGSMVQELVSANLETDAFRQMIRMVAEEAVDLRLVAASPGRPGKFEPHAALEKLAATPNLQQLDASTASVAARTATLVSTALRTVAAVCTAPTQAHAEAHLDALAAVAPISTYTEATEASAAPTSRMDGQESAPKEVWITHTSEGNSRLSAASPLQESDRVASPATPLPVEANSLGAFAAFSPAASPHLWKSPTTAKGLAQHGGAHSEESPLTRSAQPAVVQLQHLAISPKQPPAVPGQTAAVPLPAFSRTAAAAKVDA